MVSNRFSGVRAEQRERLDVLVARRGLASSRSAARQMVKDGAVRVNGQLETRPARRVAPQAALDIRGGRAAYVSRGGWKLAAALDHFGLSAAGVVALDVGASTGGFTDCLLRRGARQVVAVDVGRGQLHPRLRGDARVRALESTDARALPPLDPPPQIVLVDVSFVRLRDVLPAIAAAAPEARWLLALLKPQFELPGRCVPRDGVVKRAAQRTQTLHTFLVWARREGFCITGTAASALPGARGNRETFALLQPPWPRARPELQQGRA